MKAPYPLVADSNLRRLDLYYCNGLTCEAAQKVFTLFPRLVQIDVTKTPLSKNSLTHLTNLNVLDSAPYRARQMPSIILEEDDEKECSFFTNGVK